MKRKVLMLFTFFYAILISTTLAFGVKDDDLSFLNEVKDINIPDIYKSHELMQPKDDVEEIMVVGPASQMPEKELSFIEKQESMYIDKYKEVFYDKTIKSDEQFLIKLDIVKDNESDNPLTHMVSGYFTESAGDTWLDPMIVIMLIEDKGQYVPLHSILNEDFCSYILEESVLFTSSVELKNNEEKEKNLRIIAFKKSKYETLELNKNLQITDLSITIDEKPKFFETDKGSFKDALDALQRFLQEGKGIIKPE